MARTLANLACVLILLAFSYEGGAQTHSNYHHGPIPDLLEIYEKYNEHPGLYHWMQYGSHYNENCRRLFRIADPNDTSIHVLEIGVQSGGSTRVWRQYFGDRLRYTGLDINPLCVKFESPSDHIHIEIGSQLNVTLLEHICRTFGPFHFIIDDGAHSTLSIMTSLNVLWNCMRDNGVYAIEDLHTMAISPGGPSNPDQLLDGKDMFGHFKDMMSGMVSYFSPPWPQTRAEPTDKFAIHLSGLSVYDSIAFLHYRAKFEPLHEFRRGDEWVVG